MTFEIPPINPCHGQYQRIPKTNTFFFLSLSSWGFSRNHLHSTIWWLRCQGVSCQLKVGQWEWPPGASAVRQRLPGCVWMLRSLSLALGWVSTQTQRWALIVFFWTAHLDLSGSFDVLSKTPFQPQWCVRLKWFSGSHGIVYHCPVSHKDRV